MKIDMLLEHEAERAGSDVRTVSPLRSQLDGQDSDDRDRDWCGDFSPHMCSSRVSTMLERET